MLAQANRFHGQASLRRLLANGKVVRSSHMALKYAPNPKRATFRAAVIVSRKVSKSAVVRNRIRRRLYENVRILSVRFSSPLDMACIVYDERLASMAADQLQAELMKLCRKAQLLTPVAPRHAIVIPKEDK